MVCDSASGLAIPRRVKNSRSHPNSLSPPPLVHHCLAAHAGAFATVRTARASSIDQRLHRVWIADLLLFVTHGCALGKSFLDSVLLYFMCNQGGCVVKDIFVCNKDVSSSPDRICFPTFLCSRQRLQKTKQKQIVHQCFFTSVELKLKKFQLF